MTRPGIEPRSPGPLVNSRSRHFGLLIVIDHTSNTRGSIKYSYIFVRASCSLYNLKAALSYSRTYAYEFKKGYNATEATQNISCAKGESAIDHSTIIRYQKKIRWVCKKQGGQVWSACLKSRGSPPSHRG